MVFDQSLFCLLHSLLNCLWLLGNVKAGAPFEQHIDRAREVAIRSFSTFDDGWVRGVCVMLCH